MQCDNELLVQLPAYIHPEFIIKATTVNVNNIVFTLTDDIIIVPTDEPHIEQSHQGSHWNMVLTPQTYDKGGAAALEDVFQEQSPASGPKAHAIAFEFLITVVIQ